MTCLECSDFLMAYLDGELDPAQKAEFERHLAKCPPCVRYLDTYRKTIEMSRAAHREGEDHTPCLPPELVKAILESRKK